MKDNNAVTKELLNLYAANQDLKEYNQIDRKKPRNTTELNIYDFDSDEEDNPELGGKIVKNIQKFDAELYNFIVDELKKISHNSPILAALKSERKVFPPHPVSQTLFNISKQYKNEHRIDEKVFNKILNKEKSLLEDARNNATLNGFLNLTDIKDRLQKVESLSSPSNTAVKSPTIKRKSEAKQTLAKKDSPTIALDFEDILKCNQIISLIENFLENIKSQEESAQMKFHVMLASALESISYDLYFDGNNFSHKIFSNISRLEKDNVQAFSVLKEELSEHVNNETKATGPYQICSQLKKSLENFIPELQEISLEKQEKKDDWDFSPSLLARFNMHKHKKQKKSHHSDSANDVSSEKSLSNK